MARLANATGGATIFRRAAPQPGLLADAREVVL
jgi:hypothetical protein